MLLYLVNEVSNVSWVGSRRPEGVLMVMMDRPLIQTSDPHFDTFWLQGIRLLQLTKIVVLNTQPDKATHAYVGII